MNGITIQNAEKQQNLFEWSQRVADCRCSGLPVKRWCSEHGINLKTYYNWQSKVFAAMIEQQKTLVESAETESRFAELPAPTRLPMQTSAINSAKQNNLAASVRTGNVSIDIYNCADAGIVAALCKALCHAE